MHRLPVKRRVKPSPHKLRYDSRYWGKRGLKQPYAFYPILGRTGDAKIADYSPHRNDLATSGGAVLTGTPEGMSIGLDGSTGYASITDNTSLRPATFSIWVEFIATTINFSNYTHIIFKQGAATKTSYGIWINTSKQLYCEVDSSSAVNSVAGTTILATNVLYRACVTFDGTTIRLYLNGREEGNLTPTTFSVVYGNFPFYLGYGAFNQHFTGSIVSAALLDYMPPQVVMECYHRPRAMFTRRHRRIAQTAGGLLLRRRRAAA